MSTPERQMMSPLGSIATATDESVARAGWASCFTLWLHAAARRSAGTMSFRMRASLDRSGRFRNDRADLPAAASKRPALAGDGDLTGLRTADARAGANPRERISR